MDFFHKLTLRQRLLAISAPVTLILYIGVSIFLYTIQVKEIRRHSLPLMDQHLGYLIDLTNGYVNEKQSHDSFTKRMLSELHAQVRVSPEDTVAMGLKWNLLKQATFIEKDYSHKASIQVFELLKEDFYSKRYFTTGFPFAVDGKGYFTIHPTREGENILNEPFFKLMQEKRRGQVDFYEPKLEKDVTAFYRFDVNSGMYVCILVPTSELIDDQVQTVKISMWVLAIFSVLIFLFFITYMSRSITSPLHVIANFLATITTGNLRVKLEEYKYADVLLLINNQLDKHLGQLQNTAQFAQEIKDGKYNLDYSPSGPEDELGNALLTMRNNLQIADQERENRAADDKVRNWETEGIARFNDMLRESGQDFDTFSYNIIRGVVNYVSANLGGLYIYDQKDFSSGINTDELVLVASHAYEQQKYIDRKFKTGEGLVGACAWEQRTIFLTEIPEEYINIRSGLGESNPQSLLFVPIMLENAPFGVIELASINKFRPQEINFVEKISLTLATTLANVKNSIRTQELLLDSQEYTERMRLQEEMIKVQLDEILQDKDVLDRELITLRKKEKQTSQLFFKSIFPTMVTSEKGLIISSNQAAIQLFGLEDEELSDIFIQELIIIKDMRLFFSRNGQWQRVKAIHMKGRVTPIEVYTTIVAGKGEKIMLVYIRDMTEATRIEKSLEQEREDNRLLRNRIKELREKLKQH